jgi:hypothetical protein
MFFRTDTFLPNACLNTPKKITYPEPQNALENIRYGHLPSIFFRMCKPAFKT